MDNYVEKYKKIVDELIEKSFPELAGKRIYVSEASRKVSKKCSAVNYYFIWFSFIKVSRNLRKYSDSELRGILAHELGHSIRFEECNFFGKLWRGFRYMTSRSARTIEENACDKIAVGRGYAKGLFSAKSKRRKKGKYAKCYMSPEEIKIYAKRIKKW